MPFRLCSDLGCIPESAGAWTTGTLIWAYIKKSSLSVKFGAKQENRYKSTRTMATSARSLLDILKDGQDMDPTVEEYILGLLQVN